MPIPKTLLSTLRDYFSISPKNNNQLALAEIAVAEAEKIIFVYEPPSAISGGGDYRPESPKVANENAKKIIQKIGKDVTLLYGGSINPENISEFFSQEKINGGLVGQASTNPTTFLKLISNI